MANERKPSLYVDRGTIGSSDELDEYGVWVKSEPQDLDFADFEDPFELSETDLETGDLDFESLETDSFPDFNTLEAEISSSYGGRPKDTVLAEDDFNTEFLSEEFSIPDLDDLQETGIAETQERETYDGYDEVSLDEIVGPIYTESGPAGGPPPDLSTKLLKKIADELSSIRAELHSLKREFTGINAVSHETFEQESGSFFAGEDDGKISLTGEEMDNILNLADLTEDGGVEIEPFADYTRDSEEIDLPELAELESLELEDDITVLEQTVLEQTEPKPADLESIDLALENAELDLAEFELAEPLDDDSEPSELEPIELDIEEPDFTDLESVDYADSVDSVDSFESVESVDPVELVEPVESFEPLESLESFESFDVEEQPAELLTTDGSDLALIPEALEAESYDSEESLESLDSEESFDPLESLDSEEPFDIDIADYSSGVEDEVVPAQDEDDIDTSYLETASNIPPREISPSLKRELTAVLTYMDQLLESLPDEKIEEFARSEYFDTYKNLFKELGIV